MLLGDIRIVNGKVRLYDVDGSFEDITIDTALQIYEFVGKNRYRLLEEIRSRVMIAEKKKEKKEE